MANFHAHLKGCIRRHFAGFRLFNWLSVFLRYKMHCVVQGCSNTSYRGTGISLHCSPVSKSKWDKWVRFVKMHRVNFTIRERFIICSDNFEYRCFKRIICMEGFICRLLQGSVSTVWRKNNRKSRLQHEVIESSSGNYFLLESVSEWVITSTRIRGKPHFR